MARRTLYLNDQDDELYLKTKELTDASGDTVAGVFVRGMKDYIAEKERELQGFQKLTLFNGTQDPYVGEQGEYVEFIGKFIAEDVSLDLQDKTEVTKFLYKTRKNKYVIYTQYSEDVVSVKRLEVIENIDQLKSKALPSGFMDALKNEKSAVRFLDI